MENTNENAMAVVNNSDSVLSTHSAMGGTFCSFDTSTVEGKKRLFRAISTPDVKVKSMINKQIKVVNIFAKPTTLVDEDTGDIKEAVTVVFFDDLGVSYTATSTGIYNATKSMLTAFGTPDTWTEPMIIVPKEVPTKQGNMLTFDII